MESTVISIPNGDNNSPKQKSAGKQFSLLSFVFPLQGKVFRYPMRNVIHSIKVGIALVLVSLLYLLDPLFKQVGENAMWAIMTVVVVFEFYAGATLSKGINRGIGTILGGGLGCSAALLADKFGGGMGNAIVVGASVFLIGAAATYSRLVPSIKRRHDYGAMIFILTFSLVVVSGLRADTVMSLAGERLSTIGMGFLVCIFTSLLIFPMWASDELHHSTASKFEKLASCIEELLEEYFRILDKEGNQTSATVVKDCKSVLHSKSNDESLVFPTPEYCSTSDCCEANFARWEPWHGKFGFFYPWEKYLEIVVVLRELATIILSLQVCTRPLSQPAPTLKPIIKEACEIVGLSLAWILRELGESILKMKRCRATALIAPKLKYIKLELSKVKSTMQANGLEQDENFACVSLVFLLTEIAEKVQVVGEEVEKLGELACFQPKSSVV